jgi:uncharacterized protein YndB with AHSA1/START domain
MTDQPTPRTIDLSVEVPGTPEQVWAAIATGPGISSWFVPTTVEEREGGATTSVFGEGPEMTVPGQVAAWEPPHRVLFTGAGTDEGLAFEWLVETREGGSCVVRLVNSGFGSGAEWDAQYDGMEQGWRLFLKNLQLHLAHFPGQSGRAMLPMAMWAGDQATVWAALTDALGLPAAPAPGERVAASGDAPPLAGTVIDAEPGFRISLLLEDPLPGTAFVSAEGSGDTAGVSVYLYVYGDQAEQVVARDEPRWSALLAERGIPAPEATPAEQAPTPVATLS